MFASDVQHRWRILALLFLVRCGMGLQFQIVPALSPLYLSTFDVSVADLGLLIGLYYAPGIALAYPSGWLGQRFGDTRVALIGLFLMALGSTIMLLVSTWHGQLFGRLLAGAGAILMNVMMSKMVTDWFAGRELATAMAIFVNSWPLGISAGLLLYPIVASVGGLAAATVLIIVYLLLGAVCLMVWYRAPATIQMTPSGVAGVSPRGVALVAVLIAGTIWGLYNAALATVFGFGPLVLTERGWSLAASASLIGVTLLFVSVSVPAGGLIADRIGRPLSVIAVGFVLLAAGLLMARTTAQPYLAFVVLGMVGGLSAGPIMSLPSRVLEPQTRAIGMGLFFTMFYAVQMAAPVLAGIASKAAGASAAFVFGVVLLAFAGLLLLLFLQLAARAK